MNKLVAKKAMQRTRWVCKTILDSTKQGVASNPIMQVGVDNYEGDDQSDDNYNLVSSLAEDGKHYPALDIDIPCRFVPSSTTGHGHLYFDELGLSWERYEALLYALGSAGILDHRYVHHSVTRHMSLLRPEHVRKENADNPPEAEAK